MNVYFKDKRVCIATMHGKEKVIAPVLELELGLKCVVDTRIDTDIFGTFSGEIDRRNSAFVTSKQKCLFATDKLGYDIAIASEGSFGPHPAIAFVNADIELLMYYDKINSVEVVVNEISTDTNFNKADVRDKVELLKFADRSKFPSHALILKDEKNQIIKKGIQSEKVLIELFNENIKSNKFISVETDMRAHLNPTRMKVIERCANKLVEALKSTCPKCGMFGFVITASKDGLPCSNCASPTRSTLAFVSECKKCHHQTEKKFPHGKTHEDPMYCDFCNP